MRIRTGEDEYLEVEDGIEVVTAGGMLGRVTSLSEGYIGVQVSNGVEVQMQRSAVVQVLPKGTIK